jgi:hypothetical protein
MEKCLVVGQNAVKNVNVLVRLTAEILNEFCNLLSNKAVGVLIIIIFAIAAIRIIFPTVYHL